MVEPHRRIDLEGFPPVGAGFDGSLRTGLKIEHLILRQFRSLAVELERGRSVLPDDDEFFAESLFRIDGIGLHFDPLDERAAAPGELRRDSRRDCHGGQFARFHRLAIGEHHRHAHVREFARASGYLGLIDNTLICGRPLRLITRAPR